MVNIGDPHTDTQYGSTLCQNQPARYRACIHHLPEGDVIDSEGGQYRYIPDDLSFNIFPTLDSVWMVDYELLVVASGSGLDVVSAASG